MSIFDFKRAKENEMLKKIFEEISEEDFFIKEDKIEIKKSGIMKLLRMVPNRKIKLETIRLTNALAVVKATIKIGKSISEGFGIAEIKEIEIMRNNDKDPFRATHDMLALAETRAIKRALEWNIGIEVINIKAKEIQNKIRETGQNAKVNNTPPTYQNSKYNIQNNTQNTRYNKV
ncbi:MAG: hypothetical protein N3E37_04530 [Candidatus Micrarchaeota archaeon]|nr:hypothetical protein [Candidatus Micrarchaeota archaeon]